jgi:hypothetical protein
MAVFLYYAGWLAGEFGLGTGLSQPTTTTKQQAAPAQAPGLQPSLSCTMGALEVTNPIYNQAQANGDLLGLACRECPCPPISHT